MSERTPGGGRPEPLGAVVASGSARRGFAAPAPALVLGAIASVQTGAAIAKHLFPLVGSLGAVALRLGLSAPVLLVLARPALRGRSAGAWATGVGYGVVLAAMNATFYAAIDRIPLGVGVTLEFLGPLTLALALSRRVRDVVWALLAGGGVALLTAGGGHLSVLGVVLAVIAGGFWAAYIVLSQRTGRHFAGASGLAVALVVGAVVVVPVAAVRVGAALARPRALLAGFGVAMLSSAVPYSLELAALRRLRAGTFAVLMSLEPAMAALAGFVLLGEALRARQLLALALVSVASAGAAWGDRPAEEAEPVVADAVAEGAAVP